MMKHLKARIAFGVSLLFGCEFAKQQLFEKGHKILSTLVRLIHVKDKVCWVHGGATEHAMLPQHGQVIRFRPKISKSSSSE